MRRLGRRCPRADNDQGNTLVEVAVAAMVMAIAVTGVMGSMGVGMSLFGHSRQRSSGTAVAQDRIEDIRSYDYDLVALNEQPVYNADPKDPDNKVNTGNTMYRVDATHNEPLIVDPVAGQVPHVTDPATVGQTQFNVRQFVTWADDPTLVDTTHEPDHDYKRVVVVVTWKYPVKTGPTNTVTESTFVSKGTIELPEQGPGEGGPGATASPEPTFTPPPLVGQLLGIGGLLFPAPPQQPNPNGPCPADAQGPTVNPFEVASGAAGTVQGYVKNHSGVAVLITASDSCRVTGTTQNPDPNDIAMFLTNCGEAQPPPTPSATPSASPTPTPTPSPTPTGVPCAYSSVGKTESGVQTSVSWPVPAGDGLRRIYGQFTDANGLISGTYGVDIILDETKPTRPLNMRKVSVSCPSGGGSDRVATMTWDASSDTNFVGYRIYQAGAPSQPTTTSLSYTYPTGSKQEVTSFTVRAFDKAGNESLDSDTFSLAKNQCS